MSLSYTHFLICGVPELRPDAGTVSQYVKSIHDTGFIGPNAETTLSVVRKRETKTREMINPFTGEITTITLPSRTLVDKHEINDLSSLASLADDHDEYSVSLQSSQNPENPPLAVGVSDADGWRPFDGNYNLEIAIQTRNHLVRLAQLESEEKLDSPFDVHDLPSPIFDEDCTVSSASGVFVHPELGAYRHPQGGCASFWIEFRYGKFIYPRAVDHAVDLLCKEITMVTENAFGVTFSQASHWG